MSDVIEVVEGKSFDELQSLIEAATAAQASAKQRALEEFEALVGIVKEKAESLGVDAKSFFVEKKEYLPKYRNPENSDETWNGRGPRPAWLKALLSDVPEADWKQVVKQYLIES